MTFDVTEGRKLLQSFSFQSLFVEVLGWNRPPRGLAAIQWQRDSLSVNCIPIAELAGVVVLEAVASDGVIPEESVRRSIDTDVARTYHEHLLIFLDEERTSS